MSGQAKILGDERFRRPRFKTGIPGLDDVLRGGLYEGDSYLIDGPPGTGKTVMSFQVGMSVARAGHRVLYVTLLAESHGKLVSHLRNFSFFDRVLIARSFTLVSGFGTLRSGGLDQLLSLITGAVVAQSPRLLVIDGFSAPRAFEVSPAAFAQFVLQLGAVASAAQCTTLMVSPGQLDAGGQEWALVDGVLTLTTHVNGMQRVRELEVVKMRGSDALSGRHLFIIDDDGLRVFPRLEAEVRKARCGDGAADRLSTGVPGLDRMLRGGLLSRSCTCLMGAPGTGKTILSLKFLEEGLRRGEKCLYLGFYESPDSLLLKAESLGMPLQDYRDSGALIIDWEPPFEPSGDRIAANLLDRVQSSGLQRVVIDSVEGFHDTAARPERVLPMLAALLAQLASQNVTTLVTEELDLYSTTLDSENQRLAAHVENILLLRYVEIDSEIRRMISVMKARATAYDNAIREFRISDVGVEIGDKFAAEQVLTGIARWIDREAVVAEDVGGRR